MFADIAVARMEENGVRKLQRRGEELLGYSTSTSMLNIKTARSFTIVPRIKWIFQSLRFVYNFLPSYWLPGYA